MANVLKEEKQRTIIHLLVEGNSIRSTERLTGVHRDTIMRLMVATGHHCRDFLDDTLRGLRLRHVQIDETWTFAKKKQGHLSSEECDNPGLGDQYLFLAMDTDTKLIATYAVGKRTAELTEAFINDLSARMVLPELGDDTARKPQLSTDGWSAYPQAIHTAFADTVDYGVLIKSYSNPESGRYAPPEIVNADRRKIIGNPGLFTICTSHIERQNLTIRTFLRRFTRLSLGFSKKVENLGAAIALHVAHYNFCRRHSTLRMTPAMAAGLVDSFWSLDDLLERISLS